MSGQTDYSIKAVEKALCVLSLFTVSHDLSLTEISQKTGYDMSSTLRLLYTLTKCDYLVCDPRNKSYSLGLKVFELGLAKMRSIDLRQIARVELKKLANRYSLICYLGIKEQNKLAMVEKVLPRSLPTWSQLLMESGSFSELYSTGIGRLFLAHLSADEYAQYIAETKIKPTPSGTVTDTASLLEVVSKVRQQGYSSTVGDNEDYTFSFCAPIYDADGMMVAGISICGIKDAFAPEKQEEIIETLLVTASAISSQLGFRK